MLAAWIMEIILAIAPQYQVPPYLVAAIIMVENEGNPQIINSYNADDRRTRQLYTSLFSGGNWNYPEETIKEGIEYLAQLYKETRDVSPNWFAAVIAFNCGLDRFKSDVPLSLAMVDYAHAVFEKWSEICPERLRLFR